LQPVQPISKAGEIFSYLLEHVVRKGNPGVVKRWQNLCPLSAALFTECVTGEED
jgi:hypothetical protein